MILCASDLILGIGAALKDVMSFEARSGSGGSVRNSWKVVGVGCVGHLCLPRCPQHKGSGNDRNF